MSAMQCDKYMGPLLRTAREPLIPPQPMIPLRGPAPRGDLFDAIVDMTESARILVMVDDIVSRDIPSHLAVELDVDFRGITLADDLAPVIFINGALDMEERLRSLVWHLALLWLGISGVSGERASGETICPVARWCDEVAGLAIGPLARAAYEHSLVLDAAPKPDVCMQATTRASRRFSRALVDHTMCSKTRFTEAFRLLGVPDSDLFMAIGRSFEGRT